MNEPEPINHEHLSKEQEKLLNLCSSHRRFYLRALTAIYQQNWAEQKDELLSQLPQELVGSYEQIIEALLTSFSNGDAVLAAGSILPGQPGSGLNHNFDELAANISMNIFRLEAKYWSRPKPVIPVTAFFTSKTKQISPGIYQITLKKEHFKAIHPQADGVCYTLNLTDLAQNDETATGAVIIVPEQKSDSYGSQKEQSTALHEIHHAVWGARSNLGLINQCEEEPQVIPFFDRFRDELSAYLISTHVDRNDKQIRDLTRDHLLGNLGSNPQINEKVTTTSQKLQFIFDEAAMYGQNAVFFLYPCMAATTFANMIERCEVVLEALKAENH